MNAYDQQIVLISQYYPPGIYANHQFVPQQGASEGNNQKPRRRRQRKKNKGDQSVMTTMSKRKLSEEQANMLEQSFEDEHKLESERKDRLAAELGLDPRQVAVWFQNRRARYKSKKLEEEYARLKAEHDTTVVEKCRLEAELLKLKEQLDEAEKEIHRLSERLSSVDGFSSNSSPCCSSFSMEEAVQPAHSFLGVDEMEMNVFYENDYVHGLEWDINLYNYM